MNDPSEESKQAAEIEYGKELRESPLTVTAKRHFCKGYEAANAKLRAASEKQICDLQDENVKLRREILQWDAACKQLRAENERLRELLHPLPIRDYLASLSSGSGQNQNKTTIERTKNE